MSANSDLKDDLLVRFFIDLLDYADLDKCVHELSILGTLGTIFGIIKQKELAHDDNPESPFSRLLVASFNVAVK